MTNYKYSFINKTEEIKQITNYSNKFIVKKPVSDRESVEAKNSKS
jgi:hypothetical protein